MLTHIIQVKFVFLLGNVVIERTDDSVSVVEAVQLVTLAKMPSIV
jgi:hypothetical protein